MTVYVDEFRVWAPTRIRCFRNGSCHMTADTLEELHAMAKRLGLKRAWFQQGSTPHYDLTEPKRARALELGAAFVPAREQARKRIMARVAEDAKPSGLTAPIHEHWAKNARKVYARDEPPWHGPEDGDLWTAGEE